MKNDRLSQMRLPALTLGLVVLASGALAQDCAPLGLDSEYLTSLFCGQAQEIIDNNGTRTIGEPDWPEGPGTEWLDNELLREAYRVDPKKTLELIQRIRTAGGLPES